MNPERSDEDHEEQFQQFLDDLEERAQDTGNEEMTEVVRTQNNLLELLYNAVVYAHQSDYPSHFSSEIKKTSQIIEEFRENFED